MVSSDGLRLVVSRDDHDLSVMHEYVSWRLWSVGEPYWKDLDASSWHIAGVYVSCPVDQDLQVGTEQQVVM